MTTSNSEILNESLTLCFNLAAPNWKLRKIYWVLGSWSFNRTKNDLQVILNYKFKSKMGLQWTAFQLVVILFVSCRMLHYGHCILHFQLRLTFDCDCWILMEKSTPSNPPSQNYLCKREIVPSYKTNDS